jgi:hypothetical protein
MTARLDILKKNFVEGDTITITFTFKNRDGSLYDFTGVTKAWFTVKDEYNKSDNEALVFVNSADNPTQVTYGVGGPGEGKGRVQLLNANTVGLAEYKHRYYDFQVLKGGEPITLVIGEIKFRHEVTLATS